MIDINATDTDTERCYTFTSHALTVNLTMFTDGSGYHDLSDGLGALSEIPGVKELDWKGIESFDFDITATVGITYDYVDPDEYNNGEATDLGWAVLEVPDNANGADFDVNLPLNLIPLSSRSNNYDFKDINTNTVLDGDQLKELYEHQFFSYNNGDLIRSFEQFIGIIASPEFSVSFDTCNDTGCSLDVHSPH